MAKNPMNVPRAPASAGEYRPAPGGTAEPALSPSPAVPLTPEAPSTQPAAVTQLGTQAAAEVVPQVERPEYREEMGPILSTPEAVKEELLRLWSNDGPIVAGIAMEEPVVHMRTPTKAEREELLRLAPSDGPILSGLAAAVHVEATRREVTEADWAEFQRRNPPAVQPKVAPVSPVAALLLHGDSIVVARAKEAHAAWKHGAPDAGIKIRAALDTADELDRAQGRR